MTDPRNYENFEYVRRGEAIDKHLVLGAWHCHCCANWLASNRQLLRRLMPVTFFFGPSRIEWRPFSLCSNHSLQGPCENQTDRARLPSPRGDDRAGTEERCGKEFRTKRQLDSL